jgi:hypothetical protein
MNIPSLPEECSRLRESNHAPAIIGAVSTWFSIPRFGASNSLAPSKSAPENGFVPTLGEGIVLNALKVEAYF